MINPIPFAIAYALLGVLNFVLFLIGGEMLSIIVAWVMFANAISTYYRVRLVYPGRNFMWTFARCMVLPLLVRRDGLLFRTNAQAIINEICEMSTGARFYADPFTLRGFNLDELLGEEERLAYALIVNGKPVPESVTKRLADVA